MAAENREYYLTVSLSCSLVTCSTFTQLCSASRHAGCKSVNKIIVVVAVITLFIVVPSNDERLTFRQGRLLRETELLSLVNGENYRYRPTFGVVFTDHGCDEHAGLDPRWQDGENCH